jgi:hypothetical protein
MRGSKLNVLGGVVNLNGDVVKADPAWCYKKADRNQTRRHTMAKNRTRWQKFYDLLGDEGCQEFLDYCGEHSHVVAVVKPEGFDSCFIDTKDESAEKRFLAVYPPNTWQEVVLEFLDS